jgi:hypothetical protein
MKTIDIQRLRNLTTGKLHTEMMYIYQDIEAFTGEKGVMTHQLGAAMRALKPWLREKYLDERLWDDKYDPTHEGEVQLHVMTKEEFDAFFERFGKQHNGLDDARVIRVLL